MTWFSKANKAEVLRVLLSSGRDPHKGAPRISTYQCGWKEAICLLFSLNQIHMVHKKGLLWALFPPLRGHFALFFLFFLIILFPNPVFLLLSKVHLSGTLEGASRNSEQKFLHLNRMVFTLLTIHSD